jgi:hypothetical protein
VARQDKAAAWSERCGKAEVEAAQARWERRRQGRAFQERSGGL